MVRLATMNLTLRGLPNVRILRRNVLTTTLDRTERRPSWHCRSMAIDVVLANPPFSGQARQGPHRRRREGRHHHRDRDAVPQVHDGQPAGRAAAAASSCPEGVLFGSTGAHKELRRQLIENNRVEAVLSPAGRRVPALLGREDLGAASSAKAARPSASCSCTPTRTATSSTPITTRRSSDDDLPGLVAAFTAARNVADWQSAR